MALTTYAGLLAAIPVWAKRTDRTTDQIADYVGWAHQEICRRLRANVMLASADLTINAETISQPTGFLAFKRLYLDLTPRRKIETTSAETAMDLSADYTTGTYPSHVAKEGTLLRFAPLFTGSATGKALYFKKPTTMALDADANVVLTEYPYLYLWGALEALYMDLEDSENEQRFGSRFTGLLEDINTRDAKDTMGGPIQAMPYAGGIV